MVLEQFKILFSGILLGDILHRSNEAALEHCYGHRFGWIWLGFRFGFKRLFGDSLGSIGLNYHKLKCVFMDSRKVVWTCTFFDGLARDGMILSV